MTGCIVTDGMTPNISGNLEFFGLELSVNLYAEILTMRNQPGAIGNPSYDCPTNRAARRGWRTAAFPTTKEGIYNG
jgi:hypothetical protein